MKPFGYKYMRNHLVTQYFFNTLTVSTFKPQMTREMLVFDRFKKIQTAFIPVCCKVSPILDLDNLPKYLQNENDDDNNNKNRFGIG